MFYGGVDPTRNEYRDELAENSRGAGGDRAESRRGPGGEQAGTGWDTPGQCPAFHRWD
uniref:Uncharacterized protein n=1 Tax=Streptomyces avermitilis TaxID=33903 RepID=A0A499VJY6_STRAX|nr:hypothetical protein SAVMC3_18780 [Streptomyces avermitilis]